jgi:spermidine synthase
MARLYLLFFCSGAAGLIYQIVWVREFGNVFGNTIYSASLVLAVFMCGLGVGSYVAGRWADHHYLDAPGVLLRAYGYVEAAIAVLGLGISALLPRLGELSAAISAYAPGPAGWYAPTPMSLVARYAIAVVLLAPITGLMGGTLTLLIRHLVRRDLEAAGWRVGVLYGVNTAGAAAGCFLTDYAFIPGAGLWVTQLCAVGLNLVAAIGALRLAARSSVESESVDSEVPAAITIAGTVNARPVSGAPLSLTALAILLSGFAAMGMEIVWFRHLSALLGSFRSVLSLILTVILIGIWLGSLAGGYLHRRFGHPVVLYVLAQAVFVMSALGGLAAAETRAAMAGHQTTALTLASGWTAEARGLWKSLRPVLSELAVPALMMGFAYPLANAIAQDAERAVGRRAGLLYLANTVGALAGSLAVGFGLLPALGMQRTVTVLALAVLLGVVPLCLAARKAHAERKRSAAVALGGSLAALAVAVLVWARLPADHLVNRTLWPLRPDERRLVVSEGITEVVTVTEMPGEGRALLTDGHLMSGTSIASQRYMRAFVHIPLLSQETPESVLVICFGVGNTAHAASLHPSIRRLEVVDTSRNVLAHADYFAATNGRVIRNAKVTVYVNDGRQHLKMRPPATYDLITLEPPPIAFAGVGSLYSREFYQLARSRLRPGGYVTQWLPVSQEPPGAVLSMVRAFVDVFPQAVLLSGWMDDLILMGTNGRLEIDPARVEAKLVAVPPLREDLMRADLGTLTEIVGTFVADAGTLSAATDAYPPVTDDYPIQEYASAAQVADHRLLTNLFDPSRATTWCPACVVDGRPRPGLEGLPRHLALLAGIYRDPSFYRYAALPSQGLRVFRVALDPAVARAAVAESVYLQRVFTGANGQR